MPFAAALSEHPVTAYATGEVCGRVLEEIGTHPDLVVVFTTLAHAGALEDVVSTARQILQPTVILGAASESIVGTGQEVEGGPGISVWAGRWGPVRPIRVAPGSSAVLPSNLPFEPTAVLLVGDGYSVPIGDVLAALPPGLPVIGGMASGARGPGGNRLALDGSVYTDGAVGALLGPGADLIAVVSQGCRPVGQPLVITDGDGQIIRQLGGQPAMQRIDELAAGLTQDEIRAVNVGGLHVGRVIDERKADFSAGDFLVRQVLGADKATGAIAVNDEVQIGTTVQFHLRDAAAAHADLDRLLANAATVAPAESALLFTCNGRGERFFGTPNHDAGLLVDRLGPIPTAGFFAAGELGPVGDRNEMHSFTASVLLIREHR